MYPLQNCIPATCLILQQGKTANRLPPGGSCRRKATEGARGATPSANHQGKPHPQPTAFSTSSPSLDDPVKFFILFADENTFPPKSLITRPRQFASLVVKVFLDTTPCGGELSTGRPFHHLPHPLNFLHFRDMMSQQKTSAEVFHKQLSTAHDAPQSWAFFPGVLRGAAGYTQAEGRYAWT